MSRNIIIVHCLSVLCAFYVLGCANQQPPEGGPIDRTSPTIVATYPDSTCLLNFHDNKIRLAFDRYVNERSVEEAIFISPYVGTPEFDWSGKEVEISFPEKLRSGTTYVVNIGTDVEDLINNRMARAYTLAFSTGKELDRGSLEGRVIPRMSGDALSGVMIFAYHLDGMNPDTLNPIVEKPDFITQTGKNGDFFLHHIPVGSYRVFAVRDEYRNLVYDREVDEYGIPSGPITLTSSDSTRTGLLMKLAKEDTTGPRLLKVTSLNRNHINAEFSKTILPITVTFSSFTVIDTTDRKPLEVLRVYPSPGSANSVVVITQNQDSGKVFHLSVQGLTDSLGNKMNMRANTMLFYPSLRKDTLGARLAAVPISDSALAIEFQPTIKMTFSDAMDTSTSLDWADIFDSRQLPVATEKVWLSDAVFTLRPLAPLANHSWYALRAKMRTLHDWSGRTCRDSTKTWRFETLDIEDFSSVEGEVIDVNKTDTTGHLFVTAEQMGERVPKQYRVEADASGHFQFPQVAEGRYIFQAFRDRNNNDKYDAGNPFPFTFSERLSPFTDTLKVRARWPLEGVKIQMK